MKLLLAKLTDSCPQLLHIHEVYRSCPKPSQRRDAYKFVKLTQTFENRVVVDTARAFEECFMFQIDKKNCSARKVV